MLTVALVRLSCSFFFNDTATTEIYTLSLHDALPISPPRRDGGVRAGGRGARRRAAHDLRGSRAGRARGRDRKSTRLNSSHLVISYAVFCLKKKTGKSSMTRNASSAWHVSMHALRELS